MRGALCFAVLMLAARVSAAAPSAPAVPPPSPCPSTPEWHQFEYRDGAMRFEGETHVAASGRKVLRRMTLFNLANGHVRQRSERSVDGGKTWGVNYDYEYVRRLPAS